MQEPSDSPNALSTRKKGASGEDRATAYLVEKGYQIIARNYQDKHGEIDCIAHSPEGALVFVEVKTAFRPGCGHPFSWITPQKMQRLKKMAMRYLYEHHEYAARPCRFDAIAVTAHTVEHLRNAFLV